MSFLISNKAVSNYLSPVAPLIISQLELSSHWSLSLNYNVTSKFGTTPLILVSRPCMYRTINATFYFER
jgi:hypothetical protein